MYMCVLLLRVVERRALREVKLIRNRLRFRRLKQTTTELRDIPRQVGNEQLENGYQTARRLIINRDKRISRPIGALDGIDKGKQDPTACHLKNRLWIATHERSLSRSF